MTAKQPDISSIIALLYETAPEALGKLQDQYPEHRKLLRPGKTLGTNQEIDNHNGIVDETRVRVDLCRSALQIVLVRCEECLPRLKKRLKSLGIAQLISQIIISITGASLVVKSAQTSPLVNNIIGGLVIVSSLLAIFIQYRTGTLVDHSQSIFSYYDQLVDTQLTAEQHLNELEVIVRTGNTTDHARIDSEIVAANGICLSIKKILAKV